MPPGLVARNRRPPQWWTDAGLGIFIHWGLYSVPAHAPTGHDVSEIYRSENPNPASESPYAEWYENSLRFPDSTVARYHREHYGDAPYADFAAPFEAGLDHWRPEEWARAFADTGAGYVVLVTKHHDGYCLWPTDVPNPHRPGFHSPRDIVGELAQAVRAAGMRFGIYYSGGIDWTFQPHPLGNASDQLASIPGGDYLEYATAHLHELIDRYEPAVLWNDICWPSGPRSAYRVFEHYFSVVPDGVVNDRWMPSRNLSGLLRIPGLPKTIDRLAAASMEKGGLVPPPVPFSQFRTPEYAELPEDWDDAYEMTRGLDQSFAYNAASRPEDLLSRDDLLDSLGSTLAAGGNFLINVGPRGVDATIPDEQMERLGWMAERNRRSPWSDRQHPLPEGA